MYEGVCEKREGGGERDRQKGAYTCVCVYEKEHYCTYVCVCELCGGCMREYIRERERK